ncbi:tRNA wybutosine-synthesizing protein 5-like [Saccoglossus kowalevskii]|uniref:Uncharacterized protein LOC100377023 n=1 Tax=Saccoglossus kowalevskii TaxID=10224 RepID=A0ABM0GPL4_SACKO|nr:PREDICTED: uncharacterized protein LOC100377023 [Saccoglossus kowalevskii]
MEMMNLNQILFPFFAICVLIGSFQCLVDTKTPRGHLQPFGSHADPSVITDELDTVPNSLKFYENYVKPQKPVVFRGAAKQSRAYHEWTEEYLINEYGDLTVRLEARHEGNKDIPPGEGGLLGRDTVKHFIENYQNIDGYIISQVPGPMERDVSIPPCLLCGTFTNGIQEVHLFLSAGGGKTLVHQDPYENIHCVFNGTKKWILVHPDQTDLIYLSPSSLEEFGGYSLIDVDAVDLIKYPKIQQVKYAILTLNKGDCIYMPSGYLHQVRSNGLMNSAVAIWFSFFTKSHPFEGADCNKDLEFKPMSEVDVLWKFDGYNDLQQGHMDIYVLKTVLLTSADKNGQIWLDKFTKHFIQFEDEDEDTADYCDNIRHQFCDILDPNGRGYVTVGEVKELSIDMLKKLLLTFDPTDVSNTVEFEYSHIAANDIIKLATHLATIGPDPGFHGDEFINRYVTDIGGTPEKAKEILTGLGADETGLVTMEMVQKNIGKAVEKFKTARHHDPTVEHLWFEHLKKHGELE